MVIRMNNAQKENSIMSSDQESYVMLPITDSNEKSMVAQSYKSDHSQLVNDQSNIVHCTPTYTSQQTVLQPVMQPMSVQPNSNLVTFSFQSQPNYIIQPAIISQISQPTLISQTSITCQPSIICQPTTAVISQTPILQQILANHSLVNTDLLSQSIQNILIDPIAVNQTGQEGLHIQASPLGSSEMNEKINEAGGNLLSQAWSLSCGDNHQAPSEAKPTVQQGLITDVLEKNSVLEQALDSTFSPSDTLGPVESVNEKPVESKEEVEEATMIIDTQTPAGVTKEPENRPKYGKITHSDIADICSIVESKIPKIPKIKPKRPSIFEEMSQRMAKMLNCEVKDISVPRDKYRTFPKDKLTGNIPTKNDISSASAHKNSEQKINIAAQQSAETISNTKESSRKTSESKLTKTDLNEPQMESSKNTIIDVGDNNSIQTVPKVTEHVSNVIPTISETIEILEKTSITNKTDIRSITSQTSDHVSSDMCDEDSVDLPEMYGEKEENASLNSEPSQSGRPSRKRKLPKKLCDVTGEDKSSPTPSVSSPSPKMCLRDAKKPRFERIRDQQMKNNRKPKVHCTSTKRTSLRLKQNSESNGVSKDNHSKQDKRQSASTGRERTSPQVNDQTYTVDLSDLAVSLNVRGEVVLKMPQMMRGTGSVNINFNIEHLDEDDCLRFRIENEDNILSDVFSTEEMKNKEETIEVPTRLPNNKRMRKRTRSSSDSTSTDSDKKPPAIMKILSNNPEAEVPQNVLQNAPKNVPQNISQDVPHKILEETPQSTVQKVAHKVVMEPIQEAVKQEVTKEFMDCSTQVCFSKHSGVEEADVNKSVVLEALGFISYPRFSNITPTSTAAVRKVLKPVRKGLSLDPTDKTLTWFCALCHQPGDFGDLGPLFGPFDLMVPHEKGKRDISNTSGLSEGVKNLFEKLHSALTTLRHTTETLETHEKTNLVREVVWLHEDCVCWSPGVYMLGFDVFGLEEVFRVARVTECSHCTKLGASLGCFSEGCTLRYHYLCALHAQCTLITDTFTVLCTTHSRVRMGGSKAMQHKPLVKVRKHLLKEQLQIEFPEKKPTPPTSCTEIPPITEKTKKKKKHPVVAIKRNKKDTKSKQCHICRKAVLVVLLAKHLQNHRDKGEKRHRVNSPRKKKNKQNGSKLSSKDVPSCVDCAMEFTHHVKFIAHMSSKHNNLTPYQCKLCSRGYQYSWTLRKHLAFCAASKR